MTREEERHNAAEKFAFSDKTETPDFHNAMNDFYYGALWSDENPDAKYIYTKKQLMDMGFSFTTNGDIVTPDQLNEDLKKYLKYQKQKFIEKGKEWLAKHVYKHVDDEKLYTTFRYTNEAIENFEKWMEE